MPGGKPCLKAGLLFATLPAASLAGDSAESNTTESEPESKLTLSPGSLTVEAASLTGMPCRIWPMHEVYVQRRLELSQPMYMKATQRCHSVAARVLAGSNCADTLGMPATVLHAELVDLLRVLPRGPDGGISSLHISSHTVSHRLSLQCPSRASGPFSRQHPWAPES